MFFVSLLQVVLLQSNVAPDPLEVEVLRSRSEIKSGKLKMTCTFLGAMDKTVSNTIEIQFDESNRFMKTMNEGARDLYPLQAEPRTTRSILTPAVFMTHAMENFPGSGRLAAFVDHLKSFEALKGQATDNELEPLNLEHRAVFDPRMIGCIPSSLGLYYRASLDSYIGAPRVGTTRSSACQRNGVNLVQIEYATDLAATVAMWISEEKGNNPVRIQVTSAEDDMRSRIITSMEAELSEWVDGTKGSRWFPKHIRHSRELRSLDGVNQLLETEDLLITDAQFNIPIQKEQFTLAALELPNDTLIIHRPDAFAGLDAKQIPSAEKVEKPFKKWTGHQEVELTPQDAESRKARSASGDGPASSKGSSVRRFVWFNVLLISGFWLCRCITRFSKRDSSVSERTI